MYQQKLNGEFNLAKLQPKKVDKFIRSLKGITDSKEDNMQYVTYPNATEFNGATIECKSTIGYEDIKKDISSSEKPPKIENTLLLATMKKDTIAFGCKEGSQFAALSDDSSVKVSTRLYNVDSNMVDNNLNIQR